MGLGNRPRPRVAAAVVAVGASAVAGGSIGRKTEHMRRRRKRRVGSWLPVLGNRTTSGEDQYHWSFFRILPGETPVSNGVAPVQDNFPIVPDFSIVDPSGTQEHTLHDQTGGNAWKLRRIVGKLHLASWNTAAGEDPVDGVQWPNLLVKAGFYVARAVDGNQAVPELSAQESDPLQAGNVMNPWIWQKSWILSNPALFMSNSQQYRSRGGHPVSNMVAPSVMDGPHIDCKMQRFINKEHRLWFITSVTGYDPEFVEVSGTGASQPRLHGILDIRIYGSLARQRNFSSF